MNELLDRVIAAHGGPDLWNRLTSGRARVLGGGGLWAMKGQEGVLDDVVSRVDLHRQFTATSPFGGPGLRSSFTPARVAVETATGEVVEERFEPRAAFAGHDLGTPWDRLHLAYFNGYAMWTYLTEPFSLAGPGFEVAELEPWQEDGETWRRLRVLFPDGIETHGRESLYYIDADLRVRRHDYVAEVLGPHAPPAANYSSEHREFDGVLVPTRRTVYGIGADGTVVKESPLVTIALEDVGYE